MSNGSLQIKAGRLKIECNNFLQEFLTDKQQ